MKTARPKIVVAAQGKNTKIRMAGYRDEKINSSP
jgi:hypothetical protein